MIKYFFRTALFFVLFFLPLHSQSIESKKQNMRSLQGKEDKILVDLEQKIRKEKKDLIKLYEKAQLLYDSQGQEGINPSLLDEIHLKRDKLSSLQKEWKISLHEQTSEEAGYIYANDMSLQDFLMEYGDQEIIYLIPDEIKNISIKMSSHIPIPKDSWDDILKYILHEKGVGIEKAHPFIHRLYLLEHAFEGLQGIYTDLNEISLLPPDFRIAYYVTTNLEQGERLRDLLDRFVAPYKMTYYLSRQGILIVANAADIKKICQVFQFLIRSEEKNSYKFLKSQAHSAQTLKSVLDSYFEKKSKTFSSLPLDGKSNILFVSGSPQDIDHAESILRSLEDNSSSYQKHEIYCYRAKHSDVKELVKVLEKSYPSLLNRSQKIAELTTPGAYPRIEESTPFIVEEKTDTIIMIVQEQSLPMLLQLLKKIDIPKKMVQLEVLFFEKTNRKSNNAGLNLLRIGSGSGELGNITGATWNVSNDLLGSGKTQIGIFEFFLSRKKHNHIPAYDITYQFLISQEDLQVNSNPTVTTINQTPATIRLVDEISINTGVVAFGNNSADTYLKDAYQREEFGIFLEITPIINLGQSLFSEEGQSFITVKTSVKFDTNNSRKNNPRPDITRREIKNEVRVADGETIILGGLKRKMSKSLEESIPFFRSIPGVGKIFRNNEEGEDSQEMFICITPRILNFPEESSYKERIASLKKRPGDTKEWKEAVKESENIHSQKALKEAFKALFDSNHSTKEEGEYDGR